jgi:phage repressor protein C with HTH and peptisase S24 domain
MTFSVLELALPGREPSPAGVLLYDEEAKRLGVKMRRDWHTLGQSMGGEADLEDEDTMLLASVEGEIKRRAAQDGAAPTLHWLEDSLANVLRLSQRQAIAGGKLGFEFTLHSLYKETMQSVLESVVRPFVTHLPVYALRSAAGPFRVEYDDTPNEATEALDWLEAPSHLRLSPGMFVAEVVGDSMLPLIPNGSLCVFRKFGAGSRNNRKVLVEDRSTAGVGGAGYTVKIYHSEKSAGHADSGEQWSQNRIWLESINPEFPPIELDEEDDRYAVVAEFVSILEA